MEDEKNKDININEQDTELLKNEFFRKLSAESESMQQMTCFDENDVKLLSNKSVNIQKNSNGVKKLKKKMNNYPLTPQVSNQQPASSGLKKSNLDDDNIKKHKQTDEFQIDKPFIIGISGPKYSGSFELSENMAEKFSKARVNVLHQETFYFSKRKTDEDPKYEQFDKEIDWESYDTIDWNYFENAIQQLQKMKPQNIPDYDKYNMMRTKKKTLKCLPSPLLVVEGPLIFTNENIRNQLDIKIYLDLDQDVRLMNMIEKAVLIDDHNLDKIIEYYLSKVKPVTEDLIEPNKIYADMIIPNQGEINKKVFDMVTDNIMIHREKVMENKDMLWRLSYEPKIQESERLQTISKKFM